MTATSTVAKEILEKQVKERVRKILKKHDAWWHMPVIPDIQKADLDDVYHFIPVHKAGMIVCLVVLTSVAVAG